MEDANSDGLQLELCDHTPVLPEAIQSYKPTYKPFPWHFFAEPEGRALHDAEGAKWLATQPEDSGEIWCITFPDDTDARRSYVCPVKDCSKRCSRPGLLVSHMAVDHSELRDKKLLTFNAQLDVQSMDVKFVPGTRGAYNLGDPKFQAARKRQATQGIKKHSQKTHRKQIDSTNDSTETKHHQQVQSLNEKLLQAEIARREDAQQTTAQVLEVLKQISSTNATLVENNRLVVQSNQQLALHGRSNLPPHLQVAQQRLASKASADLARRKASN